MPLDIENQVRRVLGIKEQAGEFGKNWKEIMEYYWLEGFKEIIGNADNVFLNEQKVANFVARAHKHYPEFTPVINEKIFEGHEDSFNYGGVDVVHLPVSDRYHLQFPLAETPEGLKFLSRNWQIFSDEPAEKMPHIELRASIKLEDNYVMANYGGENPTIIPNTYVEAYRQGRNLMSSSYKIMQMFVDKTKFRE